MSSSQTFGGDWTTEKLERVRKYLQAYTNVMKNQRYKTAYIDAFAGTGSVEFDRKDVSMPGLVELAEEDSRRFIHGSARTALQVEPRFGKYIFIERDVEKCKELHKLKEEFPELSPNIDIRNGEANAIIRQMCTKNWTRCRAVMFLDPYGMQVRWETLVAIAKTRAIDLWLLFPLGVAVNRMVTKDGQMRKSWRNKLNEFFGTTDWYEAFYTEQITRNIFNETAKKTKKIASIDDIRRYFVARLKTIFADVAENPLPLYNSRNNPLFLLCFAVGNPRGAPTAMRIAQHILQKR